MRSAAILAALCLLGGGAVTVYGFLVEPAQAPFAYLTAVLFWLSIILGALLLVLITYAVNIRWIAVPRRTVEMVTATLPAVAAAFVPVLVLMPRLYSWAGLQTTHGSGVVEAIEHRAGYMNTAFFVARALLFFGVWIVLAELLSLWSRRADRGSNPLLAQKQRRLAAVGLPIFALSLTFASFDWIMSLDPRWYSSTFGVYVFTGSFLAGLSLVTVLVYLGARGEPLKSVVTTSHFVALGKLLLAFVVFWAYIAFTQFFIVWMGDMPEEVAWFVPRLQGGWLPVAIFLLVGHFALPFLVLLSRHLKERPGGLALVSLWLLACHYVDIYWLVMPTLAPEQPAPSWGDLAAVFGVGGLAVLVGLWRARGHPLVAKNDPHFTASVRYIAS